MDGILVINKEAGWTSRDVVNKVSHLLHTKKVGHTGTLDPLATGVLVLCIGSSTKLVEILTCLDKKYTAGICLGTKTDTLDTTGTILEEEVCSVSKEEIVKTLSTFPGTYLQEVPLYSAISVNGKRLYQYAHKNQMVALPQREVTIFSLNLVSPIETKAGKVTFTIETEVSKGTYIRSLVRDIASKLGTIGVMSSLNRTAQGAFTIDQAVTLDQVAKGEYQLLPIASFLPGKIVTATKEEEIKIRNGALLPKGEEELVSFLDSLGIPLAIYHPYPKDPSFLKPWKTFFKREE